MRTKITIAEVKDLLSSGKSVKVKTINNEFTKINKFWEKGNLKTYEIVLEQNYSIKTSADHQFFSSSEGWIRTKKLLPGETKLLCEDGICRKVISVNYVGFKRIVDISVEHPERCYFGNGILNHNSGKSYLAAIIAANAQKMGMKVVWFDSESSIDPSFMSNLGIDLFSGTFTYVQAKTVEFVFETIETLMETSNVLYIWDSFANTPCEADVEDPRFDPGSSMARKARVASLAMQKLTLPIANSKSTLLVLNQLRTNLGDVHAMKYNPWTTPGGKALIYAYSLRIWLTTRKGKDGYIVNDNGFRVGSEVVAKLKKSRFGSEAREASFKIVWGQDPVGIWDELSWLEALKSCGAVKSSGAWMTITLPSGADMKFQTSMWLDKLKDPNIREGVLKLMEIEMIDKFASMTGNASSFYSIDGEETEDKKELEV